MVMRWILCRILDCGEKFFEEPVRHHIVRMFFAECDSVAYLALPPLWHGHSSVITKIATDRAKPTPPSEM